jgi:hypothetical protein
MKSLMDSVQVNATEEGTEVLMRLRIGSSA